MSNLNLIIIVGLVGLIFGAVVGYSFSLPSTESQPSVVEKEALFSSKVIISQNINASGEISEISGRVITLTAEKDTLKITVSEEANLGVYVRTGDKVELEKIEFTDIKVGDKVNVVATLDAGGEINGVNVVVLP